MKESTKKKARTYMTKQAKKQVKLFRNDRKKARGRAWQTV